MFVWSEATILHADADAFFASVEQRDDPHLRGRPVIVGGGVVLAASYEAKARGVQTAMGGARARRLCPEAIVVPPRMSAYSEASKALYRVFEDATPLVEGLSIDEAFLDVRGMRRIAGTPSEIAERLRRDVRERVGIPVTVGVARTKFLAKVASGVAKPDGLLRVPPGKELDFLHPLPVERLWGVGPVTARKLRRPGSRPWARSRSWRSRRSSRCSAALRAPPSRARPQPGPAACADSAPAGSIGSQRALGRRRRSPEEIDTVLVGLVDRVTLRMRKAKRVGRTVVLRLRFDDFTRATRSHTMPGATARTEAILVTARGLLAEARPTIERQGLTLLGISVANLENEDAVQLTLPFDRAWSSALDAALDEVRAPLRNGGGDPGRASRPRPGIHRTVTSGLAPGRLGECSTPARDLPSCGGSIVMSGSDRSSQRGMYQDFSPRGQEGRHEGQPNTSASVRIATASSRPNSFVIRSGSG